MSSPPADRYGLLRDDESSDTSRAILSPSTVIPHQRHGYHRMGSSSADDFQDPAPQYSSPTGNGATVRFDTIDEELRGLGILDRTSTIPRRLVGSRQDPVSPIAPSIASIPRSTQTPPPDTPIANSYIRSTSVHPSPNLQSVPNSGNPLLSPAPWTRHGAGTFAYAGDNIDLRHGSISDQDVPKKKATFAATSIDLGSRDSGEETDGRQSHFNHDHGDQAHLLHSCPADHDIHSSRKSWLSISILSMSIYSTIFSGIWLVIALVQPRYGRVIFSGGKLTPDTASILFALFAKSIELSFVTVFVTFLGQVLSRRSLVKASRGVNIAELSMRTWVIQPGFMITHVEHMKHVGITLLGVITLTAALVAMFYTTASDALVSPHLKFGKAETRLMEGLVKSSFANPAYVAKTCQTPIDADIDPVDAGTTCLDLVHAGEAYHNSQAFLETWAAIKKSGTGVSTNLSASGLANGKDLNGLPPRPQAPGMLFDNTTVQGSWVATNSSDMTANYHKWGRIINNVTLAMPHAGIFSAARNQQNGILQPEDLAGIGEYNISASVVSPAVNVLCVNMNEIELAPIVYTAWPNATTNQTDIPGQRVAWSGYQGEIGTTLNTTDVDDVFEWGFEKYGRYPPVFPMYPFEYNSIANISVSGSDSVYLLIKAANKTTSDYTMCQFRSYLNTNCSTRYSVSGLTGGHLESHCEDPYDKMAYFKSILPDDAPVNRQGDWRNIAQQWILSLSLNTGISTANASTSRLLSQLVVTDASITWDKKLKLSPIMPSIAEHLAVLAGNTLLMSSSDASFFHYWGYTGHILDPGTYETFNASLATEQYTSGMTQRWQGMFYIVLFLVFITNVFCLVYFFLFSGLVTDYTETQNLFALAVNSPPSNQLHGSCGAGPKGEQLNVDWHIKADEQNGHFFIKESDSGGEKGKGSGREDGTGGREMRRRRSGSFPLKSMNSYSRLSAKRGSWL